MGLDDDPVELLGGELGELQIRPGMTRSRRVGSFSFRIPRGGRSFFGNGGG
jgi:hypothetical protein